MKTVYYGGKIVLEDKIEENKFLVTENGKILGIFDQVPQRYDVKYNLEGNYISSGFVDIHVHGGGGYDFNDATSEAFIGAAKEHLKHGSTAIMPTLVACSNSELKECISCYSDLNKETREMPRFLGLHLEGPYISLKQSGAIDPNYIKIPIYEEYFELLNSTNAIKRMTVAPELKGAMELGDELKKKGIVVSIGHSDAEYSQIKEALLHGFTHVTHLYSAMSMVHRKKAYRKLGVVESTYLLDDLTTEIITDGCHLPIELIELIIKIKGTDKICLITDAMRGAGMPNGTETVLGSLKNGKKVVIEEDVAFMPDMSCFAGSTCTADRCIRTLYKNTDIPLWEIVKMMTLNPCKVLNIDNEYGRIRQGYPADFVVFDEDIKIKHVLLH